MTAEAKIALGFICMLAQLRYVLWYDYGSRRDYRLPSARLSSKSRACRAARFRLCRLMSETTLRYFLFRRTIIDIGVAVEIDPDVLRIGTSWNAGKVTAFSPGAETVSSLPATRRTSAAASGSDSDSSDARAIQAPERRASSSWE